MKKIALLLTVACLLALCGCTIDLSQHNLLYDDEEKLAGLDDSQLTRTNITNSGDGYLTASTTMTGMRTIWTYTAAAEQEVELTYTLELKSKGKAKLVMISPDGQLQTLYELTEPGSSGEQQLMVKMGVGDTRIKIVGYDNALFTYNLGWSDDKEEAGQ